MKYLITGGSGFLASNFAKVLSDSEQSVVIASRDSSLFSTSDKDFQLFNSDCSNFEELQELVHDVDYIIHCSGMNAAQSEQDPSKSLAYKIESTNALLSAARNNGRCKVIYISSARLEYDSKSSYSKAHASAETVILESRAKGELFAQIFRLPNTIGTPGFSWGKLNSEFVPQLVSSGLMLGKLEVTSPLTTIRNFIPAVEACVKVIHLSQQGASNVDPSNLVAGIPLTLGEMAYLIRNIVGNYSSNIPLITHAGIEISPQEYSELSQSVEGKKEQISGISLTVAELVEFTAKRLTHE